MSPKHHCSTCGAAILWAVSELGKPIPIDPAPRQEGNIVLRPIPGGGTELIAHVLKAGEETNEPRHTTHFATCPDAETHRRRTTTSTRVGNSKERSNA